MTIGITDQAIGRLRFTRAPGGRWYHAFRVHGNEADGSPICGYELSGRTRRSRQGWGKPQEPGSISAFANSISFVHAWESYVCPNCRLKETRRVRSDRELEQLRQEAEASNQGGHR